VLLPPNALVTNVVIASLPTAMALGTTWSPPSGALFPRVRTPMRRNNLAAAVWSCNATRDNNFSLLLVTKINNYAMSAMIQRLGGGPQSVLIRL